MRFIKDKHAEEWGEEDEFKDFGNEDSELDWPEADKSREEFAQRYKLTAREASDICDDTIGFRYLRLSKYKKVRGDHCLIITMRGRHLLMKLGLLRDFIRDNKEWINPAIAFIVGILAAGVPFIIYLLSNQQ